MSSPITDSTPAPRVVELDLTGQTLAGFRILRRLGQGGMGQVYHAEQISLKRPVALKILRPELASNPKALERFKLEATTVARATHANIVQVYEFGVDDGIAWLALEFVEGRNLRDYLARKGPPEVLLALSIMRQVAAALLRAGELGIVHRDIKPENILLTRKGEVKVADFGLSRVLQGEESALNLTQSGVTMGTPLYMSPEQVEGKPLDPRTDIYSFGVTCYTMLAGDPPFRGESAFEVALAHVRQEPTPLSSIRPDLPEALCAIVHRMMVKDPAGRYQTAREVLRDVVRLRETLSGANLAAVQPSISVEPVPMTVVAPVEPTADLSPERQPVGGFEFRETSSRGPSSGFHFGRRLLAMLVLLSLPLAAGGGALLAWAKRLHGRPGQGAEATLPADASTVEAITLPHRNEQALRSIVDGYLIPDKTRNPANGLGPCMDLALLYLDTGRYDEADTLFGQLINFESSVSYQILGTTGRAIVLALRDQKEASNQMFRKVFAFEPKDKKPDPRKPSLARRPLDPVVKLMIDNPQWRYWMARARWHNNKNGLEEARVPMYLRNNLPPVNPPPRKG
jgi:serine/threonine-protein kinase